MGYYSDNYEQNVDAILAEVKTALLAADPESVERFAQELMQAEQVFFIGVGRVLLRGAQSSDPLTGFLRD